MKIVFEMTLDAPKVHSNKYTYTPKTLALDSGLPIVDDSKFNASFYIPKVQLTGSKRVKVTIEELP